MIQQLETFCEKVATLGKGYSECIYQEALCNELRQNNIVYSKEQVIPVMYNQVVVGSMRMDIVLPHDKIIIEIKAIDSELKESHFPQIITYLKESGYSCGIYINFIQNPSKPVYEIYTVTDWSGKYLCKNNFSDKCLLFSLNGTKINE